jgi:hypothetical protein
LTHGDEKVDDLPPTHVDYSNMLDYQNKMSRNNLLSVFNMVMIHFDRLVGKKLFILHQYVLVDRQ